MKRYTENTRSISSLFYTALFMLVSAVSFAGNYEAGESLFKANCASCHHMTKKITGPPLSGVMDRVPSEEWLYAWIKDNNALRASGDTYAKQIYKDNNEASMTGFAWMSDEQLDDVVTYVKDWVPTEVEGGSTLIDCEPIVVEEDNSQLLILLGVILLALLIIATFSGINRTLRNAKTTAEGGEATESKTSFEAISDFAKNNRKLFSIIVLIVVLTLAKIGWSFALSIGVSGGNGYENTENVENYKPSQPIHFKHNIHVKQNEIDCKYCHSGAVEGKHALIPSANVCMNCHNVVQEGHCDGSEDEIQKIYDATGWDPEKSKYVHADGSLQDVPREDKPIKWVKVHNLQDFVYFNHSQHVVVGGIECQTCHGDVDNMTTAEQHAPLTMGWCIDCHRTTKVSEKLAFSDKPNGYYEKMHEEFKESWKHQKDFDFTVEKIGGLECGKCHY